MPSSRMGRGLCHSIDPLPPLLLKIQLLAHHGLPNIALVLTRQHFIHLLLKLGDRFLKPRNIFLRAVEDVGESAEKESNGTSNKGGRKFVADESGEPCKAGSEGFEAARATVFFIHFSVPDACQWIQQWPRSPHAPRRSCRPSLG